MTQKFTVLFDLDGTLIDTAPDLMNAHNHVMQKFGYETKSTDEIRNLVGKGAASMIGKSLYNQAKKELKGIEDKKIKSKMVDEFIDYYGKNIAVESKLLPGVLEFLKWCKTNNSIGKTNKIKKTLREVLGRVARQAPGQRTNQS